MSAAQDTVVRAPDTGPNTLIRAPDAGPDTLVRALDTCLSESGDCDAEVARRLRVAITRLGRWIAHVHPAGVTPTQLVALGVLERTGPVRIGALADQLGTSPPTASRLVDCLHERGLAARAPDPDDHRATRVGLTPAGLASLHEHGARTTDDLTGRIGDLPADRRALLAAALPVLEEIARPADSRP